MASSVTESHASEQQAPAVTFVHHAALSHPTLLTLPQEIRNMIYAYLPTTTSMRFHTDKTLTRSHHPFLSVNQQLRYEFYSERTKNEVIEITCFRQGVDRFRTWLLFTPHKVIRITKLKYLVGHYGMGRCCMERDALFWINLTLGDAWSCDFEVELGNECFEMSCGKRNRDIFHSVQITIRNSARRREIDRHDFLFLWKLHRNVSSFAS